jgi:hypothetical protein
VRVDLDEQSRLGEVYLASLVRSQLRLGLGLAAVLALTVGLLPLVFLVPAVQHARLLGVPIVWLVLGGGCYPLLVVLAWVYVRRAERNERRFGDLVEPRADDTATRPVSRP